MPPKIQSPKIDQTNLIRLKDDPLWGYDAYGNVLDEKGKPVSAGSATVKRGTVLCYGLDGQPAVGALPTFEKEVSKAGWRKRAWDYFTGLLRRPPAPALTGPPPAGTVPPVPPALDPGAYRAAIVAGTDGGGTGVPPPRGAPVIMVRAGPPGMVTGGNPVLPPAQPPMEGVYISFQKVTSLGTQLADLVKLIDGARDDDEVRGLEAEIAARVKQITNVRPSIAGERTRVLGEGEAVPSAGYVSTNMGGDTLGRQQEAARALLQDATNRVAARAERIRVAFEQQRAA